MRQLKGRQWKINSMVTANTSSSVLMQLTARPVASQSDRTMFDSCKEAQK